jgi:hypothetical protein
MKQPLDPKSVNSRLYNQISILLDELENTESIKITIRERIAALIAIGRIQGMFMALRKEKTGDDAIVGSKVRKYAGSFKANDARGRKTGTGPTAIPDESDELPADVFGDDDDGDDD